MSNKKIFPCVRCAKSTFKKKIASKLKKMGYELQLIGGTWEQYPYIITNYNGDERQITNQSKLFLDTQGRYLCRTIPEFLAATKALAIEQGWFKEEQPEEMKWKQECPISELPPRLRRLAEYRKKHTNRNPAWGKYPKSVYYFVWADTPERYSFWSDVYDGVAPVNLEEVLDKFEKEHPELLEEPKQEAISEKETTTETEEKREVKKWPCVKCTMPEYYELIRRQVMELGWYVKVQSCHIDGDIIIHTNCMGQKRYIGPSCEMADGDYLCPDIDTFLYDCREIAIREGWFKPEPDTEEVKEEQTEPSTPTLAEARRQFRELTKHYTVEELSKNEPPRSWEEYLEQNPVKDTTELDKNMEALRRLVLMRDEWIAGWVPQRDKNNWGIRRSFGETNIWQLVISTECLSFPTQEMAEDFLNTFRDLIEETGDLI